MELTSTVFMTFQEGARVLSGTTESLSLALWGCGLFAIAAGAKALIAPKTRLQVREVRRHSVFVRPPLAERDPRLIHGSFE
jgi:hypothetical protein